MPKLPEVICGIIVHKDGQPKLAPGRKGRPNYWKPLFGKMDPYDYVYVPKKDIGRWRRAGTKYLPKKYLTRRAAVDFPTLNSNPGIHYVFQKLP